MISNSKSMFFLGAATFFVSAMVLEQILHMAVFTLAGENLTGNIWLYGLYGGLEASLAALDEQTRTTTMESLSALWTPPSYLFYMAGIERIFAITLQICFAVLMYVGVRYGKKLCIAGVYILHFLVDFTSVIVADKAGTVVTEGIILLMAVVIVTVAYRMWKKTE